ncbi:hypothetical protein HCN44_001029 [Aphidius gifuensis]|uniref:Cytochrome P450 n=1 Tax=Aphidius gifuensis TaxID=684658 RepID=A0A834XPF2_APHGI|nr:methyl farnesoate epoxidase-like [Aphidius gifuensis]KAF7988456.1 hypothetical protein HCN44_001029 [Aphidius gifuensis]
MILLCFLIFIVMWIICSQDCIKPRKFPPGPKWYPLIGAFPLFKKIYKKKKYTHLVFEELSKIYGPILGMKLGRQKLVVISGNELVKKVLNTDEFNGRPDGFFFRARSFGKKLGILFGDGTNWSRLRYLTVKNLRSFGYGQNEMYKNLNIEGKELVNYLNDYTKKHNKTFTIDEFFGLPVFNTIWTIMTRTRFSYDDKKLDDIMTVIHEAFRSNDALGGILSHLPFLRFIIPELSGYNNLMSTLDKLWRFIDDEIEHQLCLLKINKKPDNLIQAFINESGESCDRQELIILCLDLFMAGTKTTADTITIIIAVLLHYPKWQKIIQDDLDDIIGRENLPTIEHANLLPRVDAFISEAIRFVDMAPLGLPRKTMEDVSLEGYNIPKDTMVIVNFKSAHFDESCWDKPNEFMPERFLDENGNFRRRTDFLPFSSGKRRCLGETLARSSIFIFFTCILHSFKIDVPNNQELPRLDGTDGFVVSPRPYTINLIPRN